ncbi:hypothetical protein ES703_73151 [subsurface metagenome]
MGLDDLDLQERTIDHTSDVTTSDTQVVPVNKARSWLEIVNDSDTIIYLALGRTAILNKGIRLNAAGGSFEINYTNLFKGFVRAIHAGAGNKVLLITEGETKY